MPNQAPKTTVLVLCAGTNEPSNSVFLVDHFIAGMNQVADLHVQKVYLKEKHIEHFTLSFYDAATDQGQDFSELQQQIEEATAVVISSPVWNFSVPAHLKNFIDRMGSFALDATTRSKGTLGGKPFYLLFTGGSGTFVWKTIMENSTSHVREAIKYFGGTVLGTHYEQHCVNMDKTFGLVIDKRPEALAVVHKKSTGFAEVVKNYASTGKLPAGSQAKSLFYQVAQKVVKKLT